MRRVATRLVCLSLLSLALTGIARAEDPPPPDPRVKEVAARMLMEAQSASFRVRAAVTSLARQGYLEEMARQAIDELGASGGDPDPQPDPEFQTKARLAAAEWARASLSYREELPRSSYTEPKRFVNHEPKLPAAATPVVRRPKSQPEGDPTHWIVEQPARTYFTGEGKPYDVFLVRVNASSFLVEGVKGNFSYRSDRVWGSFED